MACLVIVIIVYPNISAPYRIICCTTICIVDRTCIILYVKIIVSVVFKVAVVSVDQP